MISAEVSLGDFYPIRGESVDPSRYKDETFELFSIPAYDRGEVDELSGSEIGSSKKLFYPNDVLLSRIVPHIRRCWIVPKSKRLRQIGSGEWIVFRSQNLYPGYLRYYLLSDLFNSKFMSTVKGIGGSLLRADPKQVSKFKIPLPPLEEQKKIAAILDAADELRQKDKALITKYDDLTESLFLDMFGGANKSRPSWAEKSIMSIAKSTKGSMRTGPFGSDLLHSEFVDAGIPVLGIDNVVQNRFTWKVRRYISTQKYEKLKRYTVFPNDVLISIMGTIGKVAVVPGDIGVAINTKHLAALTFNQEVVKPDFIAFSLRKDPHILSQIMRSGRGAIMTGLNLTIIKNLKLKLPPLALQKEFTDFATNIESQKATAQKSHNQSESLFKSLLQKAFKGELSN